MNAILLGGSADGVALNAAPQKQSIYVPVRNTEGRVCKDLEGEDYVPMFLREEYVLDEVRPDGTLVYGCIGVVD